MLVTQLCELLPTFSLVQLPHPSPLPKVKVQYTDSLWLGWGGEVLSCVRDHILQEFNILFLTRFKTYKISRPSPQKNLGGAGSTKSHFTGLSLITTFGIAFYQSNLSTEESIWSRKDIISQPYWTFQVLYPPAHCISFICSSTVHGLSSMKMEKIFTNVEEGIRWWEEVG